MVYRILYWVLLFLEAATLLASTVTSVSNPCIDTTKKASRRTWGSKCQYRCHCRQSTECDAKGFCPKGCKTRWIRLRLKGPCFPRQRVQNKTHTTWEDILFQSLLKTPTLVMKLKRRSLEDQNTSMYRFAPTEKCFHDFESQTFIKQWQVDPQPPVFVKKIEISFEIMPFVDDNITLLFTTKDYPQHRITAKLQRNLNATKYMELFVIMINFTISDSLTISAQMTSDNANQSCSPARIAAVLVYGHPVCPYRKWGPQCAKDCKCPCHIPECHPSSGHCWTRAFACPPKTYGPTCDMNCSSACDGGRRECHVLSGTCKECQNSSYTGIHCDSLLTAAELEARNICSQYTSPDSGWIRQDRRVNSTADDDNGMFMEFDAGDQSVALFITVGVLLAILFVGCCAYILLVRHCARKRLRQHLILLDEERRQRNSMLSDTEFSREFCEMQGGKLALLQKQLHEQSDTDSETSLRGEADFLPSTSVDKSPKKVNIVDDRKPSYPL